MPLEIEQYSRVDRTFKKVGEIRAGDSKGFISVKANGSKEIVVFEFGQDGSATVYRCNPDNTECETIKKLGQGESLGMAVVRESNLNINAEPALYNVIHK